MEWTPRPAQPFGQGNTMQLVTGHRSKSVLSERMGEIKAELEELRESHPWSAQAHPSIIEAYCKALAQYRALDDHIWRIINGEIEAHRMRNEATTGVEGVPPYLWTECRRAEASLQKMAERLGLDPAGQAVLMKDSAMAAHFRKTSGVEDLAKQGRAIREARGW